MPTAEAIVQYESQLIHDLQRDENEIAYLIANNRGLSESLASIYMLNRKNFILADRLMSEEIYRAIVDDAKRMTKLWVDEHEKPTASIR